MECPNCQFVAAPGQAAEDGTCPNCQRPYRDQPSPTQSEMTMRNMPAPGEEDPGGNPLQEGILGDYQNRARRDESFASVRGRVDPPLFFAHSELRKDPEPHDLDIEIPADLVEVIPPKKKTNSSITRIAGAAAALIPAAGEALGIGGEAAGAGAAAGALPVGEGGIGSLMKGALGKMNPGFMAGNLFGQLTGGGGASPAGGSTSQPAYQPGGVVEPPQFFSTIHEGLVASEDDLYPGSHPHIPSNDTDDPEQIDPNEKNDGQKDMDLQVGMGVNDIGGSDQGWGPDSKGVKDFANLFPLVLGYLHSDEGGEDPFLKSLHESLDAENPGYLERGNDEEGLNLLKAILTGAGLGEGDDQEEEQNSDPSDPLLVDNDRTHDPVQSKTALNQPNLTPDALSGPGMKPMNTTQQPFLLPAQGRCPTCGATISPNDPVCPQCGSPNAQTRNSATMGPANDEQKKAVAEYLLAAGRGDEVPEMIVQPWEYADELAQIAQREDPPTPPDPSQQPPPEAPVAPGPEAEMGAPPAPAGGPQMTASMQRALYKAAARLSFTVDELTGPCPECGSHSTGIVDEDGSAACKTCGHKFKSEDEPASDPKLKDGSVHVAEGLKNEIDAPAADQVGQYDSERQNDPSLAWQDTDGNGLIANRTYRLYSANYDIPDIVRINDVNPDSVKLTIQSEFGLDAPTEITYEQAQVEQYRFEPMEDVAGEDPGGFEENPDDRQPGRPEPGQETDLSTPHEMMSSTTAGGGDFSWGDMYRSESEPPPGYDPNAQQTCAQCGAPMDPKEYEVEPYPPCYQCGLDPFGRPDQADTPLDAPGRPGFTSSSGTGPNWLAQEIVKEGGAKFTPMEQRRFIDEEGTARNQDLLDLSNTHYEMGDDRLEESFLW